MEDLAVVEPWMSVDVVGRARDMLDTLRTRIPETDKLARLPKETADELEAAGMFRLLAPRRRGGLQADMPTYMDVLNELGRADISVAWVVSLLNSGVWLFATMFPNDVQDMVFASPNPNIASVLHPRKCVVKDVPGGKLIEHGIWGFNSGVYQAGWDLLGIPLANEAGEVVDFGLALIPIENVKILGDWDTIGVRGSGSSTVEVRDFFVPDNHIASLGRAAAGNFAATHGPDDYHFRRPIGPSVVLLACTILGGCDAALEIFEKKVQGRAIQHSHYNNAALAAPIHAIIGEASAKIDAAKLIARDILARWEDASKRQNLDEAELVTMRRNAGLVARLAWEAVDLLAEGAGASMMVSSNLLNRIWRDVRTASLHAAHLPATMFEKYGRMACGLQDEGGFG